MLLGHSHAPNAEHISADLVHAFGATAMHTWHLYAVGILVRARLLEAHGFAACFSWTEGICYTGAVVHVSCVIAGSG